MKAVDYIIESCQEQDATKPRDYIGMTRALDYLTRCDYSLSSSTSGFKYLLKYLAGLINNEEFIDFRQQPAHFANGNEALAPEHIDRQLTLLIEAFYWDTISVDEFYWRFEEIHPFHDGNGRLGSLLWNYYSMPDNLEDSLEHPPKNPKWLIQERFGT